MSATHREQTRVPALGLVEHSDQHGRKLDGQPPVPHQVPQWSLQTSTSCFHFPAFCRSQQTFSVKGYVVNIFGFAGSMFSVSTTQLGPSSRNEAQTIWKEKGSCVPVKLITSLTPSPTHLPLLHPASATFFPFLEHSKLLPRGLCTRCSILWAALLLKQHMSDISQFIIINSERFPWPPTSQLLLKSGPCFIFSWYSPVSDKQYRGRSSHKNNHAYRPLIRSQSYV